KCMFSVFDKSRIFIAVCCHQFILLACDMVKSGELFVYFCIVVSLADVFLSAKYPLAIIGHLLDIYGKHGEITYDIGCTFSKTLRNSSLGPCAHELNLWMMVGVFHGHAHNWMCQIDWHLMYIDGTGHMEGEGCEHIFSSLNELAHSTCHASPFHQHQAIKQHFSILG
ncbi:hypothetical protein BDR04DRAFT_1016866, partial [Suillus decipiens]